MKAKITNVNETNVESGAASIYLDLSHGEITVYHGSGKQEVVLENWNTEGQVEEGTWTKVLEAIKEVVEEGRVDN